MSSDSESEVLLLRVLGRGWVLVSALGAPAIHLLDDLLDRIDAIVASGT